MALPKLFQRIFWHNNTTPAINEDNLNAMSKAIDDIDDRVIDLGDDVITVIPQIQAYLEQAEDLVEAMELLSQNPPYIGQNGNWYVWDTNTSAFVDSGVDASISVNIADITMLAPDAAPYVTNSGTATDPIFHLFIPRGQTGNGISTIAKTATSGLVDTYTITMTDGTTSTFTVTNGAGDMNKSVYDSDNTVANAGGIKAFVNGEVEDVYAVMGQNGAKNLLVNNVESGTYNSLSVTKNSDGSLTFDGIGSSVTNIDFMTNHSASSTENKAHSLVEWGLDKNQKYIITIGQNSNVGVGIRLVYLDSSMNVLGNNYYTILSDPYNLEFTGTFANTEYLKILAYASTSAKSNVTIKPMIRLASDTDDTYQPYAKTNQKLTDKAAGLWDNMMDNGVVNVLTNNAKTVTSDKVTFTVNSDGTVTAKNTVATTAIERLFFPNGATAAASSVPLENYDNTKSYKLTGCPSGGSDSTYYLEVVASDTLGSWPTVIGIDTGDGLIVPPDNYIYHAVRIVIRAGKTVDKLFKPMLSDPSLNLSYDDYVPYAKSNRELTEETDVTFTASANETEIVSYKIKKRDGHVYGYIDAKVLATSITLFGTLSEKPPYTWAQLACNSSSRARPVGNCYVTNSGEIACNPVNAYSVNDRIQVAVDFYTTLK